MVDDKSEVLIDLDALAPPKVRLKFNGQEIDVTPPSLPDYAKIIDLSQAMRAGQKSSTSVVATYEKMGVLVKELVPELKDENLNFAQISSLFKLLSEIGAPTDQAIAKLKAQGIDLKPSKQSPKVSAS